MGVGEIMAAADEVAVVFAACSSSASGSYPSLAIRSASSLAFFSASSKSMTSPVTFLTPSFCTFLAPRMLAFLGPPDGVDFRKAADVVTRLAAGFDSAESVFDRGDAARGTSLLPALRNGDGVRPTTGGVAVRDKGGVGFLIVGLSQDEKKSSSGSPAGVELPSASRPSTITSSGYLALWLEICIYTVGAFGMAYSSASRAARRFNSSLYLVAALDWYLVLGSLLFNAAVPPFCWKNLVADSLPPTFITRS